MSRIVRLGKVALTYDMLTAAQKKELTGPTGATGATGSQGKQGIQGASLIPKNEWTAGTAYKCDASGIDVVGYQGSFYICKKSHTSTDSIKPTNTTYWMLGASIGDTGPKGEQGLKGADGSIILYGSGEPGSTLGKKDDTYLNTENWDIFTKTSQSTWTKKGNIKGRDGNAKIANNLTTDDPTYALAAPMGKALRQALFILSDDDMYVSLGTYDEWVAAGSPERTGGK